MFLDEPNKDGGSWKLPTKLCLHCMNTVPFLDHFTRRKYSVGIVVIEEQEISLYIVSFEVRFRAHLMSSCACDFCANSTVWFPNQMLHSTFVFNQSCQLNQLLIIMISLAFESEIETEICSLWWILLLI